MTEPFRKYASNKIDAAVLTQKSTLLALVGDAYEEGKRNAEIEKISGLVSDALVRLNPVMCVDCKWFKPHDCWSGTGDCHNPRFGDGYGSYPPPSVREEFYCADGDRPSEEADHE
jgi:hypothetical protein